MQTDGINAPDKIMDTQKVTAGYFTDGGTSLAPSDIHTGSVADANESYYFDIEIDVENKNSINNRKSNKNKDTYFIYIHLYLSKKKKQNIKDFIDLTTRLTQHLHSDT